MRSTFKLILLLFISLAADVHGQDVTDLKRDGLKGPVQTVRTRIATTLHENGVSSETPLVLLSSITYDKSGRRTELVLYDRSGVLSRRIVYAYDPESRRSALITYDSNNSMVRKVADAYWENGFLKNRTIEDFNEDGTLYRKMELTHDSDGVFTDIVEYRSDGTLIKKDSAPFKDSERENPAGIEVDRFVGWGRDGAKYSELDSHGNWTRGITHSGTRTYASGKKIKTTDVIYRELTYY